MTREAETLLLPLDGASLPDRSVIGGKAWSIARMRALGLPVPPAFVITTACCRAYLAAGQAFPDGLMEAVRGALAEIEAATGRRFGQGPQALLLSVRSGAAISMPGMMDTVLNLGISDTTEAALAAETGDARFARDTHRRFLEMYGRIVLKAAVPDLDPAAAPADWRAAVAKAAGREVPDDPWVQLEAAIRAVFDSWDGRRARRYRAHHGIPDDLGTAVTIQAMVFGNADQNSGTGVLFSRNPLTGAAEPYGEFLACAQGEDVVSGAHTPEPLAAMAAHHPALHDELLQAAAALERENGDVQDIEFTVERGRLFLLQSRSAKRAARAAVNIAVDMVHEGRITAAQALDRVSAEQVRQLLRPRLTPGADAAAELLCSGEAASPGVGAGLVVTDSDRAEELHGQDQDVVLVRPSTSPDDVHGMIVAKAVVTAQGGSTSHAAVVSRALGVPCVVGCGTDAVAGLEGREITVDGDKGRIYAGRLAIEAPDIRSDTHLRQLQDWAADAVRMQVIPLDAAPADALDLDGQPGGEDAQTAAPLLQGVRAAKGGVFGTDAGVQAAVDAGLELIAVPQVLPALLAAYAARHGGVDSAGAGAGSDETDE